MFRVSDLRHKDIVNIPDGKRLGFIKDIELDLSEGKIKAIVLPGENKGFSFFGRSDDLVINWSQVKKIGVDTILVELPSFVTASHDDIDEKKRKKKKNDDYQLEIYDEDLPITIYHSENQQDPADFQDPRTNNRPSNNPHFYPSTEDQRTSKKKSAANKNKHLIKDWNNQQNQDDNQSKLPWQEWYEAELKRQEALNQAHEHAKNHQQANKCQDKQDFEDNQDDSYAQEINDPEKWSISKNAASVSNKNKTKADQEKAEMQWRISSYSPPKKDSKNKLPPGKIDNKQHYTPTAWGIPPQNSPDRD